MCRRKQGMDPGLVATFADFVLLKHLHITHLIAHILDFSCANSGKEFDCSATIHKKNKGTTRTVSYIFISMHNPFTKALRNGRPLSRPKEKGLKMDKKSSGMYCFT
jgi:hypothetical protein